MEKPLVSVVICTRNRAVRLKTCPAYIERIETPCAWELVVVDNGSSDNTSSLLSEYVARAAVPTEVLFEENPREGRGS